MLDTTALRASIIQSALRALEPKPTKPTSAARKTTREAAASPTPEPPAEPKAIRRIAFIRRQTCPTCNRDTLLTCGLGLEVETSSRFSRRSIVADWAGYHHLPLVVEELDPLTVECPCCLNFEERAERIFSGRFQLPLPL